MLVLLCVSVVCHWRSGKSDQICPASVCLYLVQLHSHLPLFLLLFWAEEESGGGGVCVGGVFLRCFLFFRSQFLNFIHRIDNRMLARSLLRHFISGPAEVRPFVLFLIFCCRHFYKIGLNYGFGIDFYQWTWNLIFYKVCTTCPGRWQ